MDELFKGTKEVLNKLADAYKKPFNNDEISRNELRWLEDEFPFDFAKVLRSEIPYIDKIAKLICVMDDSLRIKVDVK